MKSSAREELTAQAMVALDAIEAGDARVPVLVAPMRNALLAVIAHARSEGADRGMWRDQKEYATARKAMKTYLDHYGGGLDAIRPDLSTVPDEYWEAIPDLLESIWSHAFERGYNEEVKGAYEFTSKKSPAQLDREIAEHLLSARFSPRRLART